ncbi:MAG: hypothetical protein ACRDVE_12645 [Actinocrinis sp.]
MTERFPQQRNRSAQRRADAIQVSGDALPAFDESFVAAASVREPSAQARALLARRPLDTRLPAKPLPSFEERPATRWSVRPSHRLAAVRVLPATACALCLIAVGVFLYAMLR